MSVDVLAPPLQSYLRMAQIRAFETRVLDLFGEKLIRGSVHPYTGQEAIAVGVCDALTDDDFITSTHRGHGHCIAKGLDLRLMMAEITGRATGYCRGKGGTMHITAMRHGMLGADAIVGGSAAIATGAAYGLRLQGKDTVVVCFFGDGASNQGIFHEAANLASVLGAPVVFVCENNDWAISTPFTQAVNVPDIAVRAAGYGFPGEIVDGNDVVAVREVAERAVARARAGDGPTLIEAKTYRITPHSAATPMDNRDPRCSRRGASATRSGATASGWSTTARPMPTASPRSTRAPTRRSRTPSPGRWSSRHPSRRTALEDVYAPAGWTTPGRLS